MKKLEQLNFDNTFARLPDTFHSRLNPVALANPYLVSFNKNAAALIDLDADEALDRKSTRLNSSHSSPSRMPSSA